MSARTMISDIHCIKISSTVNSIYV